MGLTIAQKADTLGTFRFVCVRLMETLAGWVPTSPELEVKTLFGRHIWTFAQHADLIGHRTVELRAKLHYDRPPREPYQEALRLVREAEGSGNRVSGFYDVLLPDLVSRLQDYLGHADELLDAPSVEIIRRMLADIERMQGDRRGVGELRPDVMSGSAEWIARVAQSLASCTDLVDYREDVAS
jgi:hypothetical protein